MNNHACHIHWQAHRGGGAHEAPDNTMAANIYTWALGGIPEADIRTTKDGVLICLHDETPARTTTAPAAVQNLPISHFSFSEIRAWDAGIKFDKRFAGEKVPSLYEVFTAMQGNPARHIYLDLKSVDLAQLGAVIDQYQVNQQVIFAHSSQTRCKEMKRVCPDVRTMLWIGGRTDEIKQTFSAALQSGFSGLDQVQIHLNQSQEAQSAWPYEIDNSFLQHALAATRAVDIDLEVFPFTFDEAVIHALLALDIRWFATDEPMRFLQCIDSWSGIERG